MQDRRGLKPSSAHGPGAQAQERWRSTRRRRRDAKGRRGRKRRDSGELVSGSSCRSDDDGAVLPSSAPGKFTPSAERVFVNYLAHVSVDARLSGRDTNGYFL